MAVEMRDRLGQLRHAQQQAGARDDFGVEESALEGEYLGSFFQRVEDVSQTLSQILQHTDQINYNYNKILSSVQNTEAKDETDKLMDEVKRLTHRVHNILKSLKKEIDEDINKTTADHRIKEAQVATLSRKFTEVMADYNQVQETYRDKNKEMIQRQLKYTGKSVTDDEMDKMLEEENLNVFTQDIMQDTAQKRQALGEIEARHQEIIHLEQNIRELHDMFYDMALLVEEQGEMINHIEFNVENAADHVELGREHIEKAVPFHKKNIRLKWIICGIVTGVIVVVLIVVVAIITSVVCKLPSVTSC